MKRKTPTEPHEERKLGYTCPRCKRFNQADVYAAAHWSIVLNHTCDCGRENTIKNGYVLNPLRKTEEL